MLAATASIEQLRRIPDATVEQAERSHSLYADFEKAQAPYKAALDIWVSQHFGNAKAKEYLTLAGPNLVEQILSGGKGLPTEYQGAIARGKRIGDGSRFFHWDLEFPEAFVDLRRGTWKHKNEQGFDAAVGNPPWGAGFSGITLPYIRLSFESAAKGVVDNFAVFLEAAHRLGNSGGYSSLLLPDIFLLKNYPAIRRYMLTNSRIDEIIHWGMPFPEVNLDVCSLVACKKSASQMHLVKCVPSVTNNNLNTLNVNEIPQRRFLDQVDYRINLTLTEKLDRVLQAVKTLGPRFGDLFTVREGIHSGNIRSKLFLQTRPLDNGRPLIFGRDEVRPFGIKWSGRWVHYDANIINRDIGEYANLGNPAYHEALKILVRRTGDTVVAALDDHSYFVSNNLFICIPKNLDDEHLWFCLALLNSEFSTWFFRAINPRTGRLFAELKINHLNEIPMVFLGDARHGDWIRGVSSSFRNLLTHSVDDSKLSKYIDYFNDCLWHRLAEDIPEITAYQTIAE